MFTLTDIATGVMKGRTRGLESLVSVWELRGFGGYGTGEPVRIHAPPPPPLYKLRQSTKSIRLLWRGQGRRHPGSEREDCMVSWCEKGEYNAKMPQKSELCGFKWANTHHNCVHDCM